jgi:GT2 family glycosyltransferase
MKYNLFILGYGSSKFLDAWINPEGFPNTTIRIIDNGNQTYPERLKSLLYYQTTQNLGCAGGWNLICQIAFEKLGLEKVIISNEDNLYSEEYLEALYDQCTPTNIAGTYDRAFEFSLFCIHRETYKKIGMFDENIILAAGEDNDYKHRCKLGDVSISCLGISADYNASETGGDTIPLIRDKNVKYVIEKWNNYTLDKAFGIYDFNKPELVITERLREKYKINQFPSIKEFKKYFL